ncbi:ectoine synthase [Bradyrhizobium sp. 160]|nr:ectoine synthase [Bradyrhizobium sp. 160]
MIVRSVHDVETSDYFVDWGNGTSHRLMTAKDGMGFSICHTVVRANTVSLLQYRNHLEACYCIAGEGEVEDMAGDLAPTFYPVPSSLRLLVKRSPKLGQPELEFSGFGSCRRGRR